MIVSCTFSIFQQCVGKARKVQKCAARPLDSKCHNVPVPSSNPGHNDEALMGDSSSEDRVSCPATLFQSISLPLELDDTSEVCVQNCNTRQCQCQ